MSALEEPAIGSGFKGRIANKILASGGEDFDVIDETFPSALKKNLKRVGGTIAIIQNASPLNGCPGALRRFVAVGPIRSETMVTVGIDKFKAAAASVRPFAPTPARSISHFIDNNVNHVGHEDSAAVGADNLVRHVEPESFSFAGEASFEVAEGVCGGKI